MLDIRPRSCQPVVGPCASRRSRRPASMRIGRIVDSLLSSKVSREILHSIVDLRGKSDSLSNRQRGLDEKATLLELQLCQRFGVKPSDLFAIVYEARLCRDASEDSGRLA